MALFSGRSEKPTTRTDTPDHVDSATGRTWTGADYDEARANGRQVYAPRTGHSNNQLGQPTT